MFIRRSWILSKNRSLRRPVAIAIAFLMRCLRRQFGKPTSYNANFIGTPSTPLVSNASPRRSASTTILGRSIQALPCFSYDGGLISGITYGDIAHNQGTSRDHAGLFHRTSGPGPLREPRCSGDLRDNPRCSIFKLIFPVASNLNRLMGVVRASALREAEFFWLSRRESLE